MRKQYLILFFFIALTRGAVQAQFSMSRALMEVYTGCAYSYAPDGFVYLDSVAGKHSDAIPVNLHQGDSLETSSFVELASFYNPLFPIAIINRSDSLITRSKWEAAVTTRLATPASVTLTFDSVNFNPLTRQLDVVVTALFTGSVTGDMRFNCIVVEDSVKGSGTGYNQNNAYNTTVGHPYYGAGNPIVGLYHRYVARQYLGGTWGTPGIIPSSVVFGNTYSCHYTYTVPTHFRLSQLSLVGLVSFYNGSNISDRVVLNAERLPHFADDVPQNINELPDYSLWLYPNPANSMVQLDLNSSFTGAELKVYSISGVMVKQQQLTESPFTLNVSELKKGIYIVCVLHNGQTIRIKFLVE